MDTTRQKNVCGVPDCPNGCVMTSTIGDDSRPRIGPIKNDYAVSSLGKVITLRTDTDNDNTNDDENKTCCCPYTDNKNNFPNFASIIENSEGDDVCHCYSLTGGNSLGDINCSPNITQLDTGNVGSGCLCFELKDADQLLYDPLVKRQKKPPRSFYNSLNKGDDQAMNVKDCSRHYSPKTLS